MPLAHRQQADRRAAAASRRRCVRRAPTLALDWDTRQKSRFEALDSSGRRLGVFLPRGRVVRGGDVLVGEDGSLIACAGAGAADSGRHGAGRGARSGARPAARRRITSATATCRSRCAPIASCSSPTTCWPSCWRMGLVVAWGRRHVRAGAGRVRRARGRRMSTPDRYDRTRTIMKGTSHGHGHGTTRAGHAHSTLACIDPDRERCAPRAATCAPRRRGTRRTGHGRSDAPAWRRHAACCCS